MANTSSTAVLAERAPASSPKKKRGLSARTRSKIGDFMFVVPALVLLAVFTYYPICKLFQISLTDWNLLNDTWKFVGLKNWIWLFTGTGAKYLWNSLKITFLYSLGELTVTIVGGMLFALLFNRMSRSFSLMRAIVFMPKYVAMSSAAVVFLWILNTDSGVLNYLIKSVGLQPVDWLNQKSTALISILMLTGWRVIGYGMMIYLSAMIGISKDYYEASSLDGANGRQQFFRITLPLLSPTTLFLLVTTFLSSMKVFQSVDILTSGGPSRSTEVFVYLIYRYAMVDFRMDRAATSAVMFFLILLTITIATMKYSNNKVTYDS
ncbi:carbohydrate ABC transporter permease [Pygmaiobacter massiliensis]|uniref:carbohydrate ABC transporter permease n=1 Tax=Pygmaiobacter massiliensis TaxID=1917873 RepID=UPI000C7AA0D6|nr:sugar ABC transporter permease [Pygmaiobacter massiliensis]